MTTTPKALRSRALTSAKRSLGLISELIADHLKILENGGVPDAGFSASVQKYEESRVKLLTLDALAAGPDAGEDASSDPGEVTVGREDLDILVTALTAFVPGLNSGPDFPLGRILAALGLPDTLGQPGAAGQETS